MNYKYTNFNIVTFLLLAEYRPSLGITASPSLAPCGIPPIPGHKKAGILFYGIPAFYTNIK